MSPPPKFAFILRLRLFATCIGFLAIVACGSSSKAERVDTGCHAGQESCRCLDTGLCEGSLLCSDGLCRGTEMHGLRVTTSVARACEVLLLEDATKVLEARFAKGTRGTHTREAPRTALAFMRGDDAPFEGTQVTILSVNGGALQLAEAQCFDAAGKALGGQVVVLD